MPSNKDIEKNSKAETSNKLKLYLRNRKKTHPFKFPQIYYRILQKLDHVARL